VTTISFADLGLTPTEYGRFLAAAGVLLRDDLIEHDHYFDIPLTGAIAGTSLEGVARAFLNDGILYQRLLAWSAVWARCGLPQISVGHKLAASFMATTMPSEAAASLRLPWRAFLVHVPAGLLVLPAVEGTRHTTDASIVRAHVLQYRSGRVEVLLVPTVPNAILLTQPRVLAEFGEPTKIEAPAFPGKRVISTHEARVADMASRLVLGVCAEMSSPAAIAAVETQKRSVGTTIALRANREPVTWTYVLRRDVRVDCRQAIADYVAGVRHASPSVQVLVRGHWKRQRFGATKALTKFIFVEPYWRGPEDAPVALRSHAIETSLAFQGGDDDA
jgi:hypothetical protein